MITDVKHPVGVAGVVVAEGGSSERLCVVPSYHADNWYLARNIRNDNYCAEGTWEMWVMLAKEILELEAKRIAEVK